MSDLVAQGFMFHDGENEWRCVKYTGVHYLHILIEIDDWAERTILVISR